MFGFFKKRKTETTFSNDSSLAHELEKEREMVKELKEQLLYFKNREETVANLIIDAQDRAKEIIDEAHREAASLKRKTEHGLNVRINQIEEAAQRMVIAELEIRSRGSQMKAELREILNYQLAQVEGMDITAYSGLSDLVANTAKEAQEVVATSRTVIQFPELSEVGKESATNIPVYNFAGEA